MKKQSGWSYVSQAIAFALLFGVTAWNLYLQKPIFMSLFWGVVVYFVYHIISIVTSSIIARLLHEYEVQRLQRETEEASALEEEEEEEALRAHEESRQPEQSKAGES